MIAEAELTPVQIENALGMYLAAVEKRKKQLAEFERRHKRWKFGKQQTYAQELNWLYGGAQGRISHAHQSLRGIYEGITKRSQRAGSIVTQHVCLDVAYRELMQALGRFAREVDIFYQVEKSVYQKPKKMQDAGS